MNIDDYESLPTTSVTINMTAGAIAGVLEHCVMYPLDSVKTRMQSLYNVAASGSHSIGSTLKHMIHKEGLMRPIRGVTAVVAGAGPAHALYFGSYEMTKEIMTKFTHYNHVNYMASGVVATLIHDAISNPAEVIKQRMQMYNSPYKSVVSCMKGVYKNEGFKAFYRSYSTQLVMNIPHQTIHFTTYEFFQNLLNQERRYNPPVHVVAGGAAGACAAAITTPLDVVKTLLNTQETGFTRGMSEAIRQIYTMAGPMGFFKGLTARVLYSMPATAICWSTYEFFKFYLCGLNREQYKSSITGKNLLKPREADAIMPVSLITDAALKGHHSEEDEESATYVLPTPSPVPNVEVLESTKSTETTTTSNEQTLKELSPTQSPALSTATGSIKTVCDLSSSVAPPTLNLHTMHTDVKSPRSLERGYTRT